MMKTGGAVERVRENLRQAIDAACCARGEAQWTNGYRAASRFDPTDEVANIENSRLYAKEMAQFEQCGKAEARVERLISALIFAVRRVPSHPKGRRGTTARTPSRVATRV